MDEVRELVERAFGDDVRPTDAALLHPACRDDMDLQVLYGFAHWHDVTDEAVVSEYAALAFLSAEGFRHFIPAYLDWVARHPDAPDAVVDATVWAFLPELHGAELAAFVRSKWQALDAEQRLAVTAFLQAMTDHHEDAAAALAAWRRHGTDAGPADA